MCAMTLLQASAMAAKSGREFDAAVIEIYARANRMLEMIPFRGIGGNAYAYRQEEALPGIGFRGVNQGFSESTGIINPITEVLTIAGGDIDVDRFILKTEGEDQRSTQEAMKIKALGHKWAHTIIKGDSETTATEFDGLQKRVTGGQLIAAGATANGTPLSLAKLDEAIDLVDNPMCLVMNKSLKRRFTAAARNSSVGGYIVTARDEMGRRVTSYNDLPIVVMGENDDVYNTLDFTEACTSGTATGTSIYIARFGENGIMGIENGGIDVRDLGELEAKPTLRTRIEWYSGICIKHPRCVARLYSIADAAITA